MGKLDGKVVVVTGASSGIGLATAVACGAEGADVVLLARRKDRLDAAAQQVGERALPISTDIGDPAAVNAAFEQVAQRFGRVDALVNVAAIATLRLVEECSDEDVARTFATNLLGPIYAVRAAIPLLRAAGGGDIVNVSSESTLDPFPFLTLYNTTKGGLDVFTKALAKEVREDGVRVTLFVAGTTESNFAEDWTAEEMERVIPVWAKHMGSQSGEIPKQQPEWVADALLYVLTRPRAQLIDVMHSRTHH
jgi:NAD(P)-dependent dehydrogenase (short-subunit alcohol dehydrogenase family)